MPPRARSARIAAWKLTSWSRSSEKDAEAPPRLTFPYLSVDGWVEARARRRRPYPRGGWRRPAPRITYCSALLRGVAPVLRKPRSGRYAGGEVRRVIAYHCPCELKARLGVGDQRSGRASNPGEAPSAHLARRCHALAVAVSIAVRLGSVSSSKHTCARCGAEAIGAVATAQNGCPSETRSEESSGGWMCLLRPG